MRWLDWLRTPLRRPPAVPPPGADGLGSLTLPPPPREVEVGSAKAVPVGKPDRFAQCLAVVFGKEGGFVDDPHDPGGATNMGITIEVLARWRGKPVTPADVADMTRAEAVAIYREWYWRRVRADELPRGLDLAVFDAAVNSGPGQAARWLQRAVGVADDGRIGPVTLAAVRAHPNVATVLMSVEAQRMAFLRRLTTWPRFGRGWAARVAEVHRIALAEAGGKG